MCQTDELVHGGGAKVAVATRTASDDENADRCRCNVQGWVGNHFKHRIRYIKGPIL